ncbi:MAG: DUF1349 domain-containing protein [Anaerolineaceae bacterium]|nr:DUF1349 domain-containing protein [Anaerolineaceae bacterium]
MSEKLILHETFEKDHLDPRLEWFCEPARWELNDGRLLLFPDAKTDFWRQTHYGFNNDNGHCLWMPVEGDFVLTTRVRFHPAHQYDQAGLFIRLSRDCWLKTSVEYEPESADYLGSVVTNFGYSDWATQEFRSSANELSFRVRREGNDYLVEYLGESGQWTQLRMAHLHEDDGNGLVLCGLYACSPIDAGYCAEFDFLTIEAGRLHLDE